LGVRAVRRKRRQALTPAERSEKAHPAKRPSRLSRRSVRALVGPSGQRPNPQSLKMVAALRSRPARRRTPQAATRMCQNSFRRPQINRILKHPAKIGQTPRKNRKSPARKTCVKIAQPKPNVPTIRPTPPPQVEPPTVSRETQPAPIWPKTKSDSKERIIANFSRDRQMWPYALRRVLEKRNEMSQKAS